MCVIILTKPDPVGVGTCAGVSARVCGGCVRVRVKNCTFVRECECMRARVRGRACYNFNEAEAGVCVCTCMGVCVRVCVCGWVCVIFLTKPRRPGREIKKKTKPVNVYYFRMRPRVCAYVCVWVPFPLSNNSPIAAAGRRGIVRCELYACACCRMIFYYYSPLYQFYTAVE